MIVLVDSSVWIAASSSKNEECLQLKREINRGTPIAICPLIQMEVTQGAKSVAEFQKLQILLFSFKHLELSAEVYKQAAFNNFKCRKKGLSLGTIDCIIATLAEMNFAHLWTLDKTLKASKQHLGFELFNSSR